jgi:3-isopropylmalate dehydratase small subunit
MPRKIGGRAYVLGDHADAGQLERFVELDHDASEYVVIVAGREFGARAPAAETARRLRATGIRVVVAESFAAEFQELCRATRDLRLVRCAYPLHDGFETGDSVEVDFTWHHLRDANGSAAFPLEPLDDTKRH